MHIHQLSAITTSRFCTLLVAASLAACSTQEAGVASIDQSIIGGDAPAADLVANVKILFADYGFPLCPALLLPDGVRLLTAAHCVDSHTISSNKVFPDQVLANRSLAANAVAHEEDHLVAAGTLGPKLSKPTQAFARYQHDTVFSENPQGSGINAMVKGSDLVAAGWVGPKSNPQAALFVPKFEIEVIEDEPITTIVDLDEFSIGPGYATALAIYTTAGGSERIIVAGRRNLGGRLRGFVRETDAQGSPATELIAESDDSLDGLSIAGIARAPDGTLWLSGTQNKTAMLLRVSVAGTKTQIVLATDAAAGAIALSPNGTLWSLVDLGDESKLFKVVGTAKTEVATTFADHYAFASFYDYQSFVGVALVADSNNRVLVGGKIRTRTPMMASVPGDRAVGGFSGLMRLSSTGEPDSSFGTHGMLVSKISEKKPAKFAALAIDGNKIYAAGRGVGRGTFHRLITGTFASERQASQNGTLKIGRRESVDDPFEHEGTVEMASIVVHPRLDLAILRLTKQVVPPPDYTLGFANVGEPNTTCLGIGGNKTQEMQNGTFVTATSITQGPFVVDGVFSDAIVMRPKKGSGVEATKGDSGGPCFSAPDTLSAMMIQASKETKEAIALRPDHIQLFISEN